VVARLALRWCLVRVLRAAEVGELASAAPEPGTGLRAHWLEGPANADRLDVAMITLEPGGATPPHVHIGGQVIVVVAGEGFVDVAGERTIIGEGDVVLTPPGELHVHGATEHSSLSHLTITTAGYEFPDLETPER
jgi:quercetin dioxygenase-like cupin family protein